MTLRAICFASLPLAMTLPISSAWANEAPERVKLPQAVATTFAKAFPNGEIVKLDAEEENGVLVYDVEFRDGETEKETDIAADGTMLEFTIVITEKSVPSAAMEALRLAAADATIRRIERIELSYEIEEGKLIRLPHRVTNYEALLSRGEKYAEVVVSAGGKIVEAPMWDAGDEGQPEDDAQPGEEEGE